MCCVARLFGIAEYVQYVGTYDCMANICFDNIFAAMVFFLYVCSGFTEDFSAQLYLSEELIRTLPEKSQTTTFLAIILTENF